MQTLACSLSVFHYTLPSVVHKENLFIFSMQAYRYKEDESCIKLAAEGLMKVLM